MGASEKDHGVRYNLLLFKLHQREELKEDLRSYGLSTRVANAVLRGVLQGKINIWNAEQASILPDDELLELRYFGQTALEEFRKVLPMPDDETVKSIKAKKISDDAWGRIKEDEIVAQSNQKTYEQNTSWETRFSGDVFPNNHNDFDNK